MFIVIAGLEKVEVCFIPISNFFNSSELLVTERGGMLKIVFLITLIFIPIAAQEPHNGHQWH